ncbi:unnamed protein product, partial [marine sediment metagenome]
MLFPHFQNIGRKVVTATIGEDGKAVATASFIADSFSVTMAAVIAVWPVVAYHFGIISFVAPLVNILALPVLPGIIVSGLLAGLTGIIFLPLAQVIAWFTWLFLSYTLLVVNGFAAIPLSWTAVDSATVETVSPVAIPAYYLLLGAILWLNRRRQILTRIAGRWQAVIGKAAGVASHLPLRWLIPPLLVLAILTSVAATTMPDDNLHVSIL